MRIPLAGSRLPQALLLLLVVLLPLLAFLQYRWIGQLSDAERERMQANLLAMMSRFSLDFDGELARTFMAFQMGPPPGVERTLHDYAERFARWNPQFLLTVRGLGYKFAG